VRAFGPDPARSATRTCVRVNLKKTYSRAAVFPSGSAQAEVYARASLKTGEVVSGPALIEERETTLVVPPGWQATVDDHGCVIATRG
jgi:N-methylhydantoinase A